MFLSSQFQWEFQWGRAPVAVAVEIEVGVLLQGSFAPRAMNRAG